MEEKKEEKKEKKQVQVKGGVVKESKGWKYQELKMRV